MTGCPVAHGYDPLDPDVVLDPYPTFNRLRDEGPVFYMPELDHYIITRYDDVEQVLLDRDTLVGVERVVAAQRPCARRRRRCSRPATTGCRPSTTADPPRHGPMRKSVLTVMSPRRLNALEPHLRDYAENLVRGFMDEPTIDLVDRLAFPFPGYAAFSLLGFPPEDTERLKEWSAKRVLLTYGRLDRGRAGRERRVHRGVLEVLRGPHRRPSRRARRRSHLGPARPRRRQARSAQRLRHREHGVFDGARRSRDHVQHDRQRHAGPAHQPRAVAGLDRRSVADPERGRGDPALRRAGARTTAVSPRSTRWSAASRSRPAARS